MMLLVLVWDDAVQEDAVDRPFEQRPQGDEAGHGQGGARLGEWSRHPEGRRAVDDGRYGLQERCPTERRHCPHDNHDKGPPA
jgi:hypothetical protein